MKHSINILCSKGTEALTSWIQVPKCLICLDYDGTLSEIVDEPKSANLTSEVSTELERLAKDEVVLILTGRSLTDIQGRLPANIRHKIGNHGLEGSATMTPDLLKWAKQVTLSWFALLETKLSESRHFYVENKTYSLAVHFRNSPNEKTARSRVLKELIDLKPEPHVIDGKSVINIIPPGLPDKYIALKEFMKAHNFERSLFVGDDLTDNQIFKENDSAIFSIKIGLNRALKANWHIESQKEILEFIRRLNFIFAQRRSQKSSN